MHTIFQARLKEVFREHAAKAAIVAKQKSLSYRYLEKFCVNQPEFKHCKGSHALVQIRAAEPLVHLQYVVAALYWGLPYFSVTGSNKDQLLPGKTLLEENDFCLSTAAFLEAECLCLFQTSGSTGKPSLVQHSNSFIWEDTQRQICDNHISEADVIDQIFSFSFSASLACYLPALLTGATLALFDSKKMGIQELPSFWRKNHVNFSSLPSSAFRTLARINDAEAFKSLRFVCLGAEPILPEDLQLFAKKCPAKCRLQISYATTELRTIAQKTYQKSELHQYQPDLLGYPVKPVKILRAPDQQDFGEIQVEHDEHGWTSTGDLGVLAPDGALYFKGRAQQQVKVKGRWLNLKIVEQVLLNLAGVTQVKALQNPYSSYGQVLIFYSGKIYLIEELVPLYAQMGFSPRFIHLQKFPETHSGKVNQEKLLKLVENPFGLKTKEQGVKEIIRSCFYQHFGHTNIDDDDSYFFDLGGDSLGVLLLGEAICSKLSLPFREDLLHSFHTINLLLEAYENEWLRDFLFSIKSVGEIKKDRPNLILVAHFGAQRFFKNLLEGKHQEFNTYWLHYDLFKITQSNELLLDSIFKMKDCIQQLPSTVLVGYSLNGLLVHYLAQQTKNCQKVIHIDTFHYDGVSNPGPYHFHSTGLVRKIRNAFSRKASNNNIVPTELASGPFGQAVAAFRRAIHIKTTNLKSLYFSSNANLELTNTSLKYWQSKYKTCKHVPLRGNHREIMTNKESNAQIVKAIREFIAND